MLRLDDRRLLGALDELAGIGAIEGGGCARLALSDEDKAGRDYKELRRALPRRLAPRKFGQRLDNHRQLVQPGPRADDPGQTGQELRLRSELGFGKGGEPENLGRLISDRAEQRLLAAEQRTARNQGGDRLDPPFTREKPNGEGELTSNTVVRIPSHRDQL